MLFHYSSLFVALRPTRCERSTRDSTPPLSCTELGCSGETEIFICLSEPSREKDSISFTTMSQDAVNIDQLQPTPDSRTLYSLTTGPLYSSVSNLSGLSHCIPSNQDFHYYYNFDEFKLSMGQIACSSHSMLQTIGASSEILGKPMDFPEDMDNAYGWLVHVNNEVLKQFDLSMDKFQSEKKNAKESVKTLSDLHDSENVSQLVCEKKKEVSASGSMSKVDRSVSNVSSGVKAAIKDEKKAVTKPKVPFHVHTIQRPQDQLNILVNNSNQPFEHVWLERSEDGLKYIHPLEDHSFLDFVDKDLGNLEPKRPPSLEVTPFRFVDQVKELKDMAVKLRGVNEFAVDLEHNQYRSFQGLTCLMQISTRTEDFVVDTLKLRIHVGPYLREVFKDPTKRKVMHGAGRDIIWLQRDFGIYVCNLFDTGQASKVLKLERNSLEHLLRHFCEVTANKEYQNADWRMRPLPKQMMRYAREDTHYLLYIYDLMRLQLFSMPKTSEESDAPLVEVYHRSYDVCLQLYEKELLTVKSYQRIYGLQGAGFTAQQLAVLAALFEWRDVVARTEDESTGYVLPNKTLLEIAKQMPVTTTKLRGLVKSKHPYVECNLDYVLNIIRNSMRNGAAFEAAAKQLKESGNASMAAGARSSNRNEASSPMTPNSNIACDGKEIVCDSGNDAGKVPETSTGKRNSNTSQHHDKNDKINTVSNNPAYKHHVNSLTLPAQSRQPSVSNCTSVKVLQKPVGTSPENSASKRKFDTENKEKEDAKLEQIRSSRNLPFLSFGGSGEHLKLGEGARPKSPAEMPNTRATISEPASSCRVDKVIILDSDSDAEE